MFRSRLFRAFATLAAMAAVLYVLISLYLPSSRRMIVGVDKRSGKIRLASHSVTWLPPHQFYRLSFEKRQGSAQRDGLVRIVSREGIPVVINYRLRFSIEGDRLADARRLVREGWSAWIGARVAEVMAAATRRVPVEDLLSPMSRFSAEREPLRRAVAAHLARSGLKVTAFEIARIEADRDALLRLKRAELRRQARGAAGRVAIFAIDGADWDLLRELVADGRMPHLAALLRGGAAGTLQTIQPTVSPLLWTTVATGLTPDRHGIIDFIDPARRVPVDAHARQAPAIWEIGEAFGRHAMVVNWWTSWPPLSKETVIFDTALAEPGVLHPPQLGPRATELLIPLSTVGYDQVHRFLNVSREEFERAVESKNARDPINVLRGTLSKTWSDHRVAMHLYREQQPLLLMLAYEGTDAVNHLFAPFHPPHREGVSQSAYRKFWPAVANYYAEIDRLLGEWMGVLPADTTMIVLSAHGFRWGKDRPRQPPSGGSALSDHRNPGVFLAYGNHVVPSRAFRAISIYDIAPTVLSILGLPKSEEMPGSVATWAFRDIESAGPVRVVSYGEFMGAPPPPGGATADARAYEATLQAVGHIADAARARALVAEENAASGTAARAVPPETWAAYAFHNNRGIELEKEGKTREALEAFQRAISIHAARPTPYLNMAMLLLERQDYGAAEDLLWIAVGKGLPEPDRWISDVAAFYRERSMTTRAINLLYRARQAFPQSYRIAADLGSALAQAGRYTEGLPELERALGLHPSSTTALNNLGTFYAKRNDYGRALDFWNRSLAINPHQAEIRKAAEAARTRL